jgi:hypothetical protein
MEGYSYRMTESRGMIQSVTPIHTSYVEVEYFDNFLR